MLHVYANERYTRNFDKKSQGFLVTNRYENGIKWMPKISI